MSLKWERGEKIRHEYTKVRSPKIQEVDEWIVVERNEDKAIIKVNKVGADMFPYLEEGKEYKLRNLPWAKHIWELYIDQTKKPESSGMLLLWDWDDGPSMEMDF